MAAVAAARLFLGVESAVGVGQEPLPEHVVLSAYRRRALLLHPDKNPGDARAAEVFQRLQDARDLLLGKSTAASPPLSGRSSTQQPTVPSKGAARGAPRRRPPSPCRTMPLDPTDPLFKIEQRWQKNAGRRAPGGTEEIPYLRHLALEEMKAACLARPDTSRRARRRLMLDAGRRPSGTEES